MRRLMMALFGVWLLAGSAWAQGTVAPIPRMQWFDNNGNPLAGGWICVYRAGTTTLATTYTTAALTTPIGNPIVLDAAGRATIFLAPGASYKFVLKSSTTPVDCANGTVIWTVDNISTVPASNVSVEVDGTLGESVTAGQALYLSDGSGGKTAGLWYLADADFTYASTLPQVGFAQAAITSGASGAIQIAGRNTLQTGLSVGSTYYVSATAGAITTSAPTNTRRVGQADTSTSFVGIQNVTVNPFAPTGTPTVETFLRGDTAAGAWATGFAQVCECRLTLTTNVPVTTADVTAATTVYLTPYKGNRVALYTGTVWTLRTFTELNAAVPAVANQVYDVLLDYNDGTPQLALNAWTNDTTRSVAITAQNGVYVQSGDTQKLYVGSFRTTAVAGQTEDSMVKRQVWNYFHRVLRPLRVAEGTNTWTYSTATWRQANASTANQLATVVGVIEDAVQFTLNVNTSGAGLVEQFFVGIGVNSITVPSRMMTAPRTIQGPTTVNGVFMPTLGYSYYSWMEKGDGGLFVIYGDNGGTDMQSELDGWVWA